MRILQMSSVRFGLVALSSAGCAQAPLLTTPGAALSPSAALTQGVTTDASAPDRTSVPVQPAGTAVATVTGLTGVVIASTSGGAVTPVQQNAQLQVGTKLDTTHGSVTLTFRAVPSGTMVTQTLSGGIFTIVIAANGQVQVTLSAASPPKPRGS